MRSARSPARTGTARYWHLASGEVGIARFKRRKVEADLTAAVRDLNAALEYAAPGQLLEIRIRALRQLGEAYELVKQPELASDRWARAHALEEDLVARQVSDEVRATLLEDIPTEHDERIRVAAELALSGPGGASAATAVAAAIVAMESARGAAILGRIAPGAPSSAAPLPAPGDGAAAWQWLRGIADATARDEAIWIMHARPGRVHHGIIGRNLAHHIDLPANRGDAGEARQSTAKGVQRVPARSGRGARACLPADRAARRRDRGRDGAGSGAARIKRLVVVAGGVLSDIPLAALPIKGRGVPAVWAVGRSGWSRDGEPAPIVCRFALSDLPCLSARPLLRHRSAGNRGGQALMISAFEATPEEFERELVQKDYRRVRILGHGQTDPKDASQTWLQFAGKKKERDGRIQPDGSSRRISQHAGP